MNPRYTLGEALGRAKPAQPYERKPEDPVFRRLKIYTQDPGTSKFEGSVAEVSVPYEQLRPGPVGRLFRVEDPPEPNDPGPVDLDDRRILMDNGLRPSTTDPQFRQLMSYTVATLTYERFRRALGRNPDFGFAASAPESACLILRPRAREEPNAFYARGSRAIELGWFRALEGASGRIQGGQRVFTSLSHDVLVHETTHALLDGLRSEFLLPTNSDVLALHEGFADLVALFLRFSYREVVKKAIERGGGNLRDGLLTDIAKQFYQGLSGRDRALRSALLDPDLRYRPDAEPHRGGEVLLRAVFDAFQTVYSQKTASLRRLAQAGGWREDSAVPAELVELLASYAQRLADQFLNIVIRAIDYCPPVDVTLGEYLRAMVTADYDLVPDDPWGYREALIVSFRRLGIPVQDVDDLSEDALLWQPLDKRASLVTIPGLNFGSLQFRSEPAAAASADEQERRGWALGEFATSASNRHSFGLIEPNDGPSGAESPVVHSIRTLRRLSPDGDLRFDLVAELTQRRWESGLGWFYGGSTVIIDQHGVVRYKISKHVASDRRLEQQREYRKHHPDLAREDSEDRSAPDPDRLLRRLHQHRHLSGE